MVEIFFEMRGLGQPTREFWNRSNLNSHMLRLEWLPLIAKVRSAPGVAACVLIFALSWVVPAQGQNFTLAATEFNPYAVNQGGDNGSALSTLTLNPTNGFSGTVALTCQVGGTLATNMPTCQVSPESVTPPATASLTFSGLTAPPNQVPATPGSYVVTVTGTGSAGSCSGSCTQQQTLDISVLAIAPSFTVTVQRPVQPGSVHAGTGASAIINVNSVNGYLLSGTGSNNQNLGVWMSCKTISPLVLYPPVCTFSPQPVPVTQAVQPTAVTLTILTQGNSQGQARLDAGPRNRFYALWLPLPMLAFAGIGAASSKRCRKAWGVMALVIMAASFMLIPACGNVTTTTTKPSTTFITPKNTYIFTVIGTDSNGNLSTNSGTGAPTVTLTVD